MAERAAFNPTGRGFEPRQDHLTSRSRSSEAEQPDFNLVRTGSTPVGSAREESAEHMQTEQDDYTSELIAKWTGTGHLAGVKEHDQTKVAQRLEAAHRQTLGPRANFLALDNELQRLRQEGFFGRSMNSGRSRR